MNHEIRDTLHDSRNTRYAIRNTIIAPLHLSRTLYKSALIYAKQTQFHGCSNERKLTNNNELSKFYPAGWI